MDHLVTILLQLAGLQDTPISLSSCFIVEELLKIRTLKSSDFCKLDTFDTPKVTVLYIRLSKGPFREYEPVTESDELSHFGLKPLNRPLKGPSISKH
jgi:hypothetical protein